MRNIWTHRDIGAPAADVWSLLVEPEHWPSWGPSVRSAKLDGQRMEAGGTGVVTTVFGAQLEFQITTYVEGSRWAWKVQGIDATDHRVEPLEGDRCRVSFGVPWVVAPYQAICGIAMQRIKTIAERSEAGI